MVEQIIVGVDGSSASRAALRWALTRAGNNGATVLLEHVIDASRPGDGESVLADAVELSKSFGTLPVEARLLHGIPARTLARESRRGHALVMGTHKTGFLHGRVSGMGSIVVAAGARGSVVVVPEENLSGRRGVIVGVARGSDAAVVAGALEAKRLGQDLSLLHACGEAADAAESGRMMLAAASRLASETASGLTIRSRVSRRRPADALLDASHVASLLVVGAGPVGGFIGSVAHEVLLNLNSPVMVARP